MRIKIRPRIPFSIKLYFFLLIIFVAFIVTIMSFFGTPPAVKHTFDIDYEIINNAYQKKDNWLKDLAALKVLLKYDWKNFNQAKLDKVNQSFASNIKPEDIVGRKHIDEYNDLLELYKNTLNNYAGNVEHTVKVSCSPDIIIGSEIVTYDKEINQNIATAKTAIQSTVNGKVVTTTEPVVVYSNPDHNVLSCKISSSTAEIRYKVFEKTAYFPIETFCLKWTQFHDNIS